MSVQRLRSIPGFNIDRVAAAAGDDRDILRMENLDTDVAPPAAAVEASRDALGELAATGEMPGGSFRTANPDSRVNSWLPFTGRDDLKQAVAASIERRGGPSYDGPREVVITCGEGDAMLDALFCLTDPGDEVVLTDPTYAGMINRVRLVGAEPRLADLVVEADEWRLNLESLEAAVTDRTRVIFVNNASFPTGWVASDQEWEAITRLCRDHDLWLLYWAGFEGVLYDGRTVTHPAALPGMRDRTVTLGAPTFERRMIAWRIGWVVAPGDLVNDVSRAHIYNGLVPSGFGQIGTRVALGVGDDDLAAANAEWQRRRDTALEQLAGLPVVRPAGGWSFLLDVAALGLEGPDVSRHLMEHRVAATPMVGWGGPIADRHLRFVFSREPVDRLADLGSRVRAALEAAAQ